MLPLGYAATQLLDYSNFVLFQLGIEPTTGSQHPEDLRRVQQDGRRTDVADSSVGVGVGLRHQISRLASFADSVEQIDRHPDFSDLRRQQARRFCQT